MEYLSETLPIYTYEKDGWTTTYRHDEVSCDEYDGLYYAKDTNREVRHTLDEPAKWWCVALYETDRAYGGPEEGGWWYTCGWLVDHAKIRFFDNYKDAYDYSQELWAYCLEENKDRGDMKLAPLGFTEQMPDTHFPKNRPYYS